MKRNSLMPPMRKSNSNTNLNPQGQFKAILNILKSLSEKVDYNTRVNEERIKKFEEFKKSQEEKLDVIISSIQTLNVSNGGKFDNPLLKPLVEISPNTRTNESVNIGECLTKGGEDPK